MQTLSSPQVGYTSELIAACKHKIKRFYLPLTCLTAANMIFVGITVAQSLTQPQQEYKQLWRYCPIEFVPPELNYQPQHSRLEIPLDMQQTVILADEAVVTDMEVFELSGDVQVTKGNIVINAEEMEYQRNRDLLTAQGGIRMQADNVLIIGDQARMSLSGKGGVLDGDCRPDREHRNWPRHTAPRWIGAD